MSSTASTQVHTRLRSLTTPCVLRAISINTLADAALSGERSPVCLLHPIGGRGVPRKSKAAHFKTLGVASARLPSNPGTHRISLRPRLMFG